jgi:hypothetical protein
MKAKPYLPLLIIVAIFCTQFAVCSTPSLIGVKAGDWAIYDYTTITTTAYHYLYDSTLTPRVDLSKCVYKIEVLKTTQENITFHIMGQINSTYEQMTQNWLDLRTVTANPAVLQSDPYARSIQVHFTLKDLKPGDQLPRFLGDFPIVINSTKVLKIGDVSREVNYVQIRNERNETDSEGQFGRVIQVADLFYDRSTGLMVRWDYTRMGLGYVQNELYQSYSLYQGYVLRETNVWSEPFWLNRDVLGSLDVVLLLLVVVLGIAFLQRRVYKKRDASMT